MSHTTINFENTFAAINSAIFEVNKRKEYLEAKNSELIVLKREYDDAVESLDDIARDYQSENGIMEKLTAAKNIMGDLWNPENEEKLKDSIRKCEDFNQEENEYLQKLRTLTKSIEAIQAEFTKKEEIAANKVETPKVETPKQEKKDDAIVDSKAVIKFAENGGYKVIIGNGKELDCTIFQDVRNILDNLADEVFNNTFTVKYAKNRNKNSDKAFFVFFAKPNHC